MGYLMHPTEWSSDFHGTPQTSSKKIPQKLSGTLASSSVNSGSGRVKPSLPFNQKVVCSPLPCGRKRRGLVSHRGGRAAREVWPLRRPLSLPCLLTANVVRSQRASKREQPQRRKGLIIGEILISLGFADKLKWTVSNGLGGEGPSRLNFAAKEIFKK